MKLPVIYFDKEKYIEISNKIFGVGNYSKAALESGIVDAYHYDHNTQHLVLYKGGYKFICSTSATGIYLELR